MAKVRRTVRGARTDGARKLDRLLRERNISLPLWCDRYGVSRLVVQRLLAGGERYSKAPPQVMAAAYSFSGGLIAIPDWAPASWREDAAEEAAA